MCGVPSLLLHLNCTAFVRVQSVVELVYYIIISIIIVISPSLSLSRKIPLSLYMCCTSRAAKRWAEEGIDTTMPLGTYHGARRSSVLPGYCSVHTYRSVHAVA